MPRKRDPATALDVKRVAIYTRVSTQYQVDRASLPVQREELVAYSKYVLGIDSYDIFEDAGYSAKNTDRPDYQRMISRIRAGEFTHLLVWKIDRISRNLLDFAAMYDELKRLGVTFVSKNEQFDTSSAMGEAMLKIILVFAELERNMTSERVSAIMLSRATSGVWNGGKVPFGYKYDKESKTFSINEVESKTILLIYDLYESRQSLIYVSKTINEKGIRARSGKPWSPNTVRTMLTNPFYTGTYRYNYHDESDATFHQKPENEWIFVEDHHPAIVTKERQAAVIAILESHNRNHLSGSLTYQRKHIHIFAGLLRCGCCGSTMASTIDRARADGNRPSVYACTRRRRFNDCQNKYVTDKTLAPFVLNFMANLIRASNSFGKSTSIETLGKKLLRGPAFESVDHIDQTGLRELYEHLRRGFGEIDFKPPSQDENAPASQEREILLSEHRRLDRALNRLQSLYLYSDDSMPEKDYVIERKRLLDQLNATNARLEELDARESSTVSLTDEEFMAKASYFVLTQRLLDKRFIDFEKFIEAIDAQILKDFLNSTISNFCIKNGFPISVLFKNGIELKFSYKSPIE